MGSSSAKLAWATFWFVVVTLLVIVATYFGVRLVGETENPWRGVPVMLSWVLWALMAVTVFRLWRRRERA